MPKDLPTPSIHCCGIRIDCIDLDQAVQEILARALDLRQQPGNPHGLAVHLCNAWTLAYGLKAPAHADRIDSGDLNLPDGMPLVWLARRFGLSMNGRVYGPDLMSATLDAGRAVQIRHYLFGTTTETLSQLQTQIELQFPGALIVGSEAPPFRAITRAEEQSLAERLTKSGADVVWVGLGTPQQDELVYRLRPQVGAVIVPVGAAFDFLAGNKSQAPQWMQKRGLEWLFRLGTEPKRLWRRYLIGNLQFLTGSAPDFFRAFRNAPSAPSIVRPWSAAWNLLNVSDHPEGTPIFDASSDTTRWMKQINLAGSLQAYGAEQLIEQFVGPGSAAEHLSQILDCDYNELSAAAVDLLRISAESLVLTSAPNDLGSASAQSVQKLADLLQQPHEIPQTR
ncbi:MAG: WecB/TagA/CpsF family glycosyltransferase [Microthrixaceae bacterium]